MWNVTAGGTRPGAGRTADLAKQTKAAADQAIKLKYAMSLGLDELAKEYPFLMKAAIAMAFKGNATVLLTLIKIPIAMLPHDGDSDNPFSDLLKKWQGELHLHQHINEEKPDGQV